MATTEQEKKQNPETPSNQGVGTSQTSETYNAGYKPIDNSGRDYDKEKMSPEDYARTKELGAAWNAASAAGNHDEAARIHEEVEGIRGKYDYEGGIDGSQYISKSKTAAPNVAPIDNTAPDFSPELTAWLAASQAQQQAQIDYATNKGVKELKRAEEDAQEQFQTQQNQTDRDEAKALDNQALYAEARGDRGGIGEAQYAQIQATAMQNRRAINSARTKLATDTSRAIADLRAQGEFQKADALLQLTQTYLGQLIELQQWGAEYTLSVDQFNIGLQQWQAEFGEQARQFNLEFNENQRRWGLEFGEQVRQFDTEFNENQRRWGLEFGLEQEQFRYAKNQDSQNKLAQSGYAALAVGIRPSKAQQNAMGYTDAQIEAELNAYKLAQAAGVKLTGDGDGDEQDYDGLFEAALKSGKPQSFIANNYKKYGFTSNTGLYNDYKAWAESLPEDPEDPESPESTPVAFEGGASYKSLYNTLSRAPGITYKEARYMIQSAYQAGKINDEEMDRLWALLPEVDEEWLYKTYGAVRNPDWFVDQVNSGRMLEYVAENGKIRFKEVPSAEQHAANRASAMYDPALLIQSVVGGK